jgi:hypothetical protein
MLRSAYRLRGNGATARRDDQGAPEPWLKRGVDGLKQVVGFSKSAQPDQQWTWKAVLAEGDLVSVCGVREAMEDLAAGPSAVAQVIEEAETAIDAVARRAQQAGRSAALKVNRKAFGKIRAPGAPCDTPRLAAAEIIHPMQATSRAGARHPRFDQPGAISAHDQRLKRVGRPSRLVPLLSARSGTLTDGSAPASDP